MRENSTLKLAKFITELEFEDLQQNTIDKAKMVIIDYLSAILAGHDKSSLLSDKLIELILQNGGVEEATIIGTKEKVPLINAAFANGVLSHVVELDDGHRLAKGHPGVVVVSSALPTAEYLGSTGKDLITAIVAGYDVFVRIASSVNPSHLNRGFHTTGTCGTFAAATAAAKLLKLNELETANALGLAGIQAAGLLEVTIDGQMAKALHPGKAAYGGVLSAVLAKQGVQGPKSIIEGDKGFAKAMSDECDYELMFKDINEKFLINDCYIKLYPSCRHTHAPVDSALDLLANYDFKIEEINSILIKTYPTAISFAGKIFKPENTESAKFSIAYCTCAALRFRNFGLKELEYLNDSVTLDLIDKVKIEADESLESLNPKIRGAEVCITLNDGRKLRKRIDLPKGEIENPVSKKELIKKFYSCTDNYFEDKYRRKIVESIFNIDKLIDVGDFVTSLSSSMQ
ncbi:MAG: MmgE/PrpD family protein [Sedimentibacter sp.]